MTNGAPIPEEERENVILPDGLELNMTQEEYANMRLVQGYSMEILLVVDQFCRDNGLTYYLGEGTLLGAVRHGGFIPWDDDVDILMPRADYDRFLQLAKDGLPEGYALESMDTNPRHWTVIAQVQMVRKVSYSKKRLEGIALHNGPCIDVFPLDFVPSDRPEDLKERGSKLRVLRRTMWIKSGLHDRQWYTSLRRRLKLYYPLKIYGMFRSSLRSIYDQVQQIMTATNDPSLGYLCIFGSLYPARRETFKKEYFGTPRYMEFEGHMLPVPSDPDKILKRIYGDYMQYPPVKTRKSKHFFSAEDETADGVGAAGTAPEPSEAGEPGEAGQTAETAAASAGGPADGTDSGMAAKLIERAKKLKKKLRTFVRKARGVILRARIARYYKLPIREKTVLYDAFSGLGVLDSPRALFKRLLEREEFRDLTHVWAINDEEISKFNMEEFSGLANVRYVKRNSKEYLRWLTTAKYLIVNSSVPQYYARRPEQVYLNTWHGVPTKVMGYERPGQRVNATENIVHNFLNATHLVAANHFTGERMYKRAYLLDGIYEGKLLDAPLPRTDATCHTDRSYVLDRLKKAGIATDKKIIVYAPTWKGKFYNALDYDLDELKNAVRTLRENIDTDEYEVFLRVHYFLYRAIMMDEEMKKICIPFTIDTNELLSVVDILISDYSSIFFDFLSTRRPILFYVPDLEQYTEDRGLYIPMEDMPGPVSTTLEEVADGINHIERVRKEYAAKYDAMYEWCSSNEDGTAADRVIDAVFLNKDCPVMNCRNGKIKLLFMAEFSKAFVMQTALAELFRQIDYSKYDVTLLTGKPKGKHRRQMLEDLDPHVRILINNKAINCRRSVRKAVYAALRKGTISLEDAVKKLECPYEWQRLAGDSAFDRLCVLQPTTARPNWLLLSYMAPVGRKVFIQAETAYRSAAIQEALLGHFDAVYDDLDQYRQAEPDF